MRAIAAGIGVATALVACAPLLIVASFGAPPQTACVTEYDSAGQPIAVPATTSAAGLEGSQLRHAATVIAVGRRRGIPDRGIVVALATALQESRLRVYANDGLGGDLAPDQRGIRASLRLPHDAVGTDHGSLGIFQQQWPWWGSMRTLMDPAESAGLFYDALQDVAGWQSLPVTVAAQAVQRSAYPTAYADDEPLARRLLDELGAGMVSEAVDCSSTTAAGGAARVPLPRGSGYVDQRNFAATGSSWASWHTGTDLSVACGTPVLAAHAGKVHIRTDQGWAGPWLVQVAVGPGRLTTWYAHMQSIRVAGGARVEAGQQIGEVGARGNATGCHLHFEVHPKGGGIYEDPVDPSKWLASRAVSARGT